MATSATSLAAVPGAGAARPQRAATIAATSDRDGYHLYALADGPKGGGRWRPLATLQPGGYDGQPWIGEHCLTGDGREVVAVVAPWRASNRPTGVARGGLAYAVDARSGAVRPLAAGVALTYFNPGCGAGGTVALTSYLGPDQATTRISLLDAASGASLGTSTARGELTSAVPVGHTIVAAAGGRVLQLDGNSARTLGRVAGQAFDLRPNQAGGVDLLAATGREATVWRADGHGLRKLGGGRLGDVALLAGRSGRNLVAGAERLTGDGPQALPGAAPAPPAPGSLPRPAPATAAVPSRDLTAAAAAAAIAANTTAPTCAVPRNDLWNQVLQPGNTQVRWAVEQAVRGRLVPGNIPARPAQPQNFKIGGGQPLPSYYPSLDFPPVAIAGHPGAVVPPQLLFGILAQESNWNQASWHALSGYGGNPLIADYYGSSDPSDPADIDYDKADCGYGIGQITDLMRVGAAGPATQVAIATDYAENIAAAAQVLAQKWNQLAGIGVTMNGGDPTKLENWYGAIWAYNSGVHRTADGEPRNGLGWFNNPANPIYPPDRHPFLHSFGSDGTPVQTYDDARTPQRWPYQEKVFGWMETPQADPEGHLRYAGTYDWGSGGGRLLSLPPAGTFCTPGVNTCTWPSANPCPSVDASCWWDAPAQWANCAGGQCTANGPFEFTSATAPEPPRINRGIPCSTSLPAGALVVDDAALADQNPQGADPNVVGCPTTPSGWANRGTFALHDAAGQPLGAANVASIDLHQLGGGFGGHIWFTHTRPNSDAGRGVVGEWHPNLSAGLYDVRAFVPTPGATTSNATYQVHTAAGPRWFERTVNQNGFDNQWVDLGTFPLFPGSWVSLSSLTPITDPSQGADIAFDAMAFVPVAPGHTITVGQDNAYTFKGFGTSLAWWAEVVGPWNAHGTRDRILTSLYGKPDPSVAGDINLGLNVVRYNIGASPKLPETQSCSKPFRDGALVPTPVAQAGAGAIPSRDAQQLAVLLQIDQLLRAGNQQRLYEAFANSPPWWLTTSQCSSGNSSPSASVFPEDQAHYRSYADYLTSVVKAFHDLYGIDFATVEPFNEPHFAWGRDCTSNCQEGAHLSTTAQSGVVEQLCGALLNSGVATQISAPDENSPDDTIGAYRAYSDLARACVLQINSHSYQNGVQAYSGTRRGELAQLASGQSTPRGLWISEFGNGGGPLDTGAGITLSRQIAMDLQYARPQAWVYWQAVEAAGNGNWGLIAAPSWPSEGDGTFFYTKRYYALAQYSRFIRPGYQILTARDPGVDPAQGDGKTLTVAARDPSSGRVVLVATNDGQDPQTVSYDLTGLGLGTRTVHVYRTDGENALAPQPDLEAASGSLGDVQPAQSVTTYVIDP